MANCRVSRHGRWKKEIEASSSVEAAMLWLKQRGWATAGSVMVEGGDGKYEFLDCELSGGIFKYAKRTKIL